MSTEIKFTDTAVVWNHGQQVLTTGGDILCTLVDENGNELPDRELIAGRIVNCWNAGRYYEEPLDREKLAIAGIAQMLLDLYDIQDEYLIIDEPEGMATKSSYEGLLVISRSWFTKDIDDLEEKFTHAKDSIIVGFYDHCRTRLTPMGMEQAITFMNAEIALNDCFIDINITIK